MSAPAKNDPTMRACLPIFILGLCFMLAHPGKADTTPLNRIEIYVYGPGIAQVIDVHGRRSGRNLVTGDILEEIPRSKIVKEQTKERTPGWTIQLQDPTQGTYRMKLVATGPGGFVIDVDTVDSAGNLKNSHVFRRVKPGDSLEFLLTYSSDSGGKNTLLKAIAR